MPSSYETRDPVGGDSLPSSSYILHHRGNNGRGGAGLLVLNSIHSDVILLPTRLHAVAARVILSRSYSVCSLYFPLSESVSYEDLADLIKRLQPTMNLIGDFNIRHPKWEELVHHQMLI